MLIDVCVISAKAGASNMVSRNAREDAAPVAAAVQSKRARHGTTAVPLVFDVGGRPSDEAKEWVRGLAARVDEDSDSTLRGNHIPGRISCILQRCGAAAAQRPRCVAECAGYRSCR